MTFAAKIIEQKEKLITFAVIDTKFPLLGWVVDGTYPWMYSIPWTHSFDPFPVFDSFTVPSVGSVPSENPITVQPVGENCTWWVSNGFLYIGLGDSFVNGIQDVTVTNVHTFYVATEGVYWYDDPVTISSNLSYYDPSLATSPTISYAADDAIAGVLPTKASNLRLVNDLQDYTTITHLGAFLNARIKIYQTTGNVEDLSTSNIALVFVGNVDSVSQVDGYLDLNVFDNTSRLNERLCKYYLPSNFQTSCDPAIKYSPRRFIYGKCDGVVLKCLETYVIDTPATTDNRKWLLPIGADAVGAVRIQVDGTWYTINASTYSIASSLLADIKVTWLAFTGALESTNGIPRTITGDDVVVVDGVYGDGETSAAVFLDRVFYGVNYYVNPIMVIAAILIEMGEAIYIDVPNFQAAYDLGQYLVGVIDSDDETGVPLDAKELITRLLIGMPAILQCNLGKWQITQIKPMLASTVTISDTEIISGDTSFEFSTSEMAGTVRVNYAHQEMDATGTSFNPSESTNSGVAKFSYSKHSEKGVQTYLADPDDASDLSRQLSYVFGDRRGLVSLTGAFETNALKVGDVVTLERDILPGFSAGGSRFYLVVSVERRGQRTTIVLDDLKGVQDNAATW